MSPRKLKKLPSGLEEPSFKSTLGWSLLIAFVMVIYIRFIW